jgi:hypothetical protein
MLADVSASDRDNKKAIRTSLYVLLIVRTQASADGRKLRHQHLDILIDHAGSFQRIIGCTRRALVKWYPAVVSRIVACMKPDGLGPVLSCRASIIVGRRQDKLLANIASLP